MTRYGYVGCCGGLSLWERSHLFTYTTMHLGVSRRAPAHHSHQSKRHYALHLQPKSGRAACNAMHGTSARLCRWLLQSADRIGSDEVPLTQEFLAQMLGARRTTVTLLAQRMRAKGLIRYRRGRIVILDRKGLDNERAPAMKSPGLPHFPWALLLFLGGGCYAQSNHQEWQYAFSELKRVSNRRPLAFGNCPTWSFPWTILP